jgi:hypothetical protein
MIEEFGSCFLFVSSLVMMIFVPFFCASAIFDIVGGIRLPRDDPAIAPCANQEPPSTYGLEDHPIGPIYMDAKAELDRFNKEIAKVGTMDRPNFNTARKSTYDVAFGKRK